MNQGPPHASDPPLGSEPTLPLAKPASVPLGSEPTLTVARPAGGTSPAATVPQPAAVPVITAAPATAATMPMTDVGSPANATLPMADTATAAAPTAPGAAATISAFHQADPDATIDASAPTRITEAAGSRGQTPAPTTDASAATRLSTGALAPGTGRMETAGGLTGTGTRRRTRINQTLPADTQDLDLKLQLSRVSVFADMASRADGHLTRKLTRMVEEHGTQGRYAVQRPLASGGMGAVLEIKDGDFQRLAAMKIILPRFASTPETLERFLAEAQVTAQLEHPNIVPIHDLGVMDDGTLYFTMKFIEGQSLGGVLKKLKSEDAAVRAEAQAAWTQENLLLTFLKVLDGVGFAHSRGVVHRDLKPDNIMLGGHGEVLVVDWGIAKVMGQADHASDLVRKVVSVRDQDNLSATMAGNAIGTIYYMPPEQAEGRLDDIDPRSDVYALGATLYELITRKRPLEAASLQLMVERVAAGSIIPILIAKPDLHPDVAAMVMKAMAFSREGRYQSCGEFAADIRRFLAGQAVAARRRNLIERLGAWVQQHRRQALIGAGVVLLTAAAIGGTLSYQAARTRADAAQLRDEASQALAAYAASQDDPGKLDEAKEKISQSLHQNRLDEEALAIQAQIRSRLEMRERERGEREKIKQARTMLAGATSRFAAGHDAALKDIVQELDAAWKLAKLDGITELRLQVDARLRELAVREANRAAEAEKLRCDGLIAQAVLLSSGDAAINALVDSAVGAFKAAHAFSPPPAGLDDTRVQLEALRERIARERQAVENRRLADEQTTRARTALAARNLDAAGEAIAAAFSRLPQDPGILELRDAILEAKRQAQRQAETAAQRSAARERARQSLAEAQAAQERMGQASERIKALTPRIAELERTGRDRAALVSASAEQARAQRTVAEQWALVEQSAAAVVTALDTDRDYAVNGAKPWMQARQLLAALYWGRLAVAQEHRALPEIAAFTNLLQRFDDGTYEKLLAGDGTLSIQGSGNATLSPLVVTDGRLLPGEVNETLVLPLAARAHAAGRFRLQAPAVDCAIYLPPNGKLALALPASLPTVPGHDCRMVLAGDGKSFLLGTREITQGQYYAFITDREVWPRVQASWKATAESANGELPLALLPRQAKGLDSVTWQFKPIIISTRLDSVSLPEGLAELPVTGITRDDAEGYCAWLTRRSSLTVRLPTRAEWQYAANGGDPQRIYPWGDTFDRTFPVCAMSFGTGKADVQKPGSHPADIGPFGHLDLAGNVREWLSDRAAPGTDLAIWHGAIMAGGGYFDASPEVFRSTYTESLAPDTPHGQIGFRILVEIP